MSYNSFVIDSNIWISFIIKKKIHILSDFILDNKLIVFRCEQLEYEILDVLNRTKFEKYISKNDISESFILFQKLSLNIILTEIIKQNRDSKDDFLFTLCETSKANYLVSGDKDVLESNIKPPPFILTMNEFINKFK